MSVQTFTLSRAVIVLFRVDVCQGVELCSAASLLPLIFESTLMNFDHFAFVGLVLGELDPKKSPCLAFMDVKTKFWNECLQEQPRLVYQVLLACLP